MKEKFFSEKGREGVGEATLPNMRVKSIACLLGPTSRSGKDGFVSTWTEEGLENLALLQGGGYGR